LLPVGKAYRFARHEVQDCGLVAYTVLCIRYSLNMKLGSRTRTIPRMCKRNGTTRLAAQRT